MARMKLVRGELKPLTQAEEARRDAEDAAFAARKMNEEPPPRLPRMSELWAALKRKGVLSDADLD